jgi:hypothetical protein
VRVPARQYSASQSGFSEDLGAVANASKYFARHPAKEPLRERVGRLASLVRAKTAGLATLTHVRDAAERAWLGRRTSALADLFVAPFSVAQNRAMAI